jgi:serine/threonine protein kinase
VALGTPAFMAPEQARGRARDVGPCTDVWGLGATLFALLTGRFVHAGESAGELLFMAGSLAAPRLSIHRPDVPSVVTSVVDRALAFEAQKRFKDAGVMLTALRAARFALERGERGIDPQLTATMTIEEEIGPSARSVSPRTQALSPRTRNGSVRLATALALLAAVGLAAGVGMWPSRINPTPLHADGATPTSSSHAAPAESALFAASMAEGAAYVVGAPVAVRSPTPGTTAPSAPPPAAGPARRVAPSRSARPAAGLAPSPATPPLTASNAAPDTASAAPGPAATSVDDLLDHRK